MILDRHFDIQSGEYTQIPFRVAFFRTKLRGLGQACLGSEIIGREDPCSGLALARD